MYGSDDFTLSISDIILSNLFFKFKISIFSFDFSVILSDLFTNRFSFSRLSKISFTRFILFSSYAFFNSLKISSA